MKVVERQEPFLVKADAREVLHGGMHVRRAEDEELLRPAVALEADDVAVQMQIHLAPHADRERGRFRLVQALERRALLPEGIVGRMAAHLRGVVPFEEPRGALRRLRIDHPCVLVVPDARELAGDAARVGRGAVGVDVAVVGCDAGETRRVLVRHAPLHARIVGLADAADAAVGPLLRRDPADHLDEVALLVAVHVAVLALGAAAAAHIHVHIRVPLLEVPLDRPGLAP